jgi:hypothetical protein
MLRTKITKFARQLAPRIGFSRQPSAGRSAKRIRLTRSIILDGGHAEEGSIHDLAQPLADHLIAQGSAVQVNFFLQFFSRIWFFVDRRTGRKERN